MKKIFLISAICAINAQVYSQSWNLTGNSGTNTSANFIGTTDNVAFKIRTNNLNRITVSSAGKVGIGTTSPVGKLHVKGNTNVSQLIVDANSTQSNSNPLIKLRKSNGTDLLWIHSDDVSNSFVGFSAGAVNNATGGGISNTFIGGWAGFSNTTGSFNTACGQGSLFHNTTGNSNTAYGVNTLYQNTTGSYNTASGRDALFNNTAGTKNTASGYGALANNTTGNSNTANGYLALYANSTGIYNTASGDSALYANTSSENTAYGYAALAANTTGNANTASGAFALRSNTTGYSNTAGGNGALYYNTTGNSNTAFGINALAYNATGNYNTAIGWDAGVPIGIVLNHATAIGAEARVNADNKVRLGHVNITVVEGQVAYSWPSDGRFKENIKDDVNGLDFILKLKPVSYNFNRLRFAQHVKQHLTPESEKNLVEESQNRSVGFIAQDVEKIIQQTGFNSFDAVHAPTNETDNYSLGYAEFVVPLVKAVQELSKKNDDLKPEVRGLKLEVRNQMTENQKLIQRVEKLESLLDENNK